MVVVMASIVSRDGDVVGSFHGITGDEVVESHISFPILKSFCSFLGKL